MRRRKPAFIAVLCALLAMAGISLAANTNSPIALAGLPPITLSVDADSAAVDELDDGDTSPSKAVACIACSVSGQAVVLLVRIERASNGLFLDVLADSTTTTLQTRLNSMSLTSRSHPSPAKDSIDQAVLTAAAGD